MKISQQLKIKQNQSLIMTPQLQQAIKLLQLTNVELNEFVEKAKIENPFLKENYSSIKNNYSQTNNFSEEKLDLLQNSKINVDESKFTNDLELSNSFDTHISQNNNDKQNNISKNHFEKKELSITDVIEKTEANKISLRKFLVDQINLTFEKKDQNFAILMIDYLHQSGWLTVSLEEIASDLKLDLSHIKKLLLKLQDLEPVGIFSRNLSECLKIQLRDKDLFNKKYDILIDNLDLLTKGKVKYLSKLCKINNEEVIEMVSVIKTLNPKPAEGFYNEEIRIAEPDIIVVTTKKGWKIDLNKSTLPSIELDEEFIEEMSNIKLPYNEENNFSVEKIGEAKWLKKAVDQRNKTILKVASEILKKQVGFFKHGFSHMKPLILKDVADAIGMHESTISRVTNSKLILTDWGLLSLKDFFSASIPSSEETDKHAASAVREALKKLITNEISSKPLSDEKIADVLSNQGIDVARRTVAKYRDMLNIPSSAERKRKAKFNKLLSAR